MRILMIFLKFILPLGILYLAFTYLGTLGGICAALLYFVFINYPLILQNIAAKKYTSGDYAGSFKTLEKALRFSPRNARLRAQYAYLLLKTGKTDEAAVEIDKALEDCRTIIEKNSFTLTKALVVWKQDRIDEAISMLEELIKEYRNTNVYGALGFMYIEKGDIEKSLSFNLEAYDYNSTNPVIVDNLGYTRYLRGEYDEALALYKQLMKLRPGFPVAFYNYACVLEHFDRLDEAIYMCNYALSLKFWNISTITREKVEEKLAGLEKALKAREEASEASAAADSASEEHGSAGSGDTGSTESGDSADIS
jgi:tetratricopeptide (TPR) repeat protein